MIDFASLESVADLIISPVPPPTTAESERVELVRRIVASRHFVKAMQLQRILIYICEKTLADPFVVIREHDIGCNVLGRRPDFNPHEDNIVRVQVSHLRRKLDEYFATEGHGEPLRITIPKGSYIAHFAAHTMEAESPPEERLVEAPPKAKTRSSSYWGISALAAALILSSGYLVWNRSASPAEMPFWARIFGPGQTTNIVAADTCLVMMQDILDTDISLAEYLSKEFPHNILSQTPDGPLRSALALISARQYTSVADMNIASKLMQLSERTKNKASIRYARFLNVRDFKTDNFVLIGSRRGIPWAELFESQVNFALEEDPETKRYFFRNKAPKPGESTRYGQSIKSGSVTETYAAIELLPNLGNNGHVLILSGIGMEATEAAGELVSNPYFADVLRKTFGQAGKLQTVPYFEILLRIRAVAGTPGDSEVLAYRVIQPHIA
jgi:hypothetical protein